MSEEQSTTESHEAKVEGTEVKIEVKTEKTEERVEIKLAVSLTETEVEKATLNGYKIEMECGTLFVLVSVSKELYKKAIEIGIISIVKKLVYYVGDYSKENFPYEDITINPDQLFANFIKEKEEKNLKKQEEIQFSMEKEKKEEENRNMLVKYCQEHDIKAEAYHSGVIIYLKVRKYDDYKEESFTAYTVEEIEVRIKKVKEENDIEIKEEKERKKEEQKQKKREEQKQKNRQKDFKKKSERWAKRAKEIEKKNPALVLQIERAKERSEFFNKLSKVPTEFDVIENKVKDTIEKYNEETGCTNEVKIYEYKIWGINDYPLRLPIEFDVTVPEWADRLEIWRDKSYIYKVGVVETVNNREYFEIVWYCR